MSDEEIGSAAEEAAKLFGALAGWAREHGGDLGHGVADAAQRSAHDLNEHLATGSAECQYCPVCRGIHLVRELHPEVRTHLAVAGASLMQAAGALLATVAPEERTEGTGRRRDDLEHIDLDEPDEDGGPWPE